MISNPLILCSPSQNKRTTGRGQTFACQQILERHMFQVETKAKQPPQLHHLFCTTTPQDTYSDLVAHCQVISVQLASLLELLIAFPPLPAGHMHGQGSPGSTTARLTRWGSSGTTPTRPSAQSRRWFLVMSSRKRRNRFCRHSPPLKEKWAEVEQ